MTQPLALDRGAVYRVINTATGKVIAQKVRVADTLASRGKGLLGRTGMEPEEGLLITPCDSVHTFFMQFPIDLLYLDKDMRVVRVVADMGPSRMSFCLGKARHVLELMGGSSHTHSGLAGDQLKFEKQA